jgi:hypothetical protein
VRRLVLPAMLVAVCGLAVALGACSDDGDSSSDSSSDESATDEAVEPDLDRYCALADDLAERSSEALADATNPEEFDDARVDFVEDYAELLDEQVAVAPNEIADDAELRLDVLRRDIAGDEISVDEREELVEANERLMAFEDENC